MVRKINQFISIKLEYLADIGTNNYILTMCFTHGNNNNSKRNN